jgi:replication factor C subunit 2/4
LSQDKIVGRLKQIADAEKVEYTPEALQSLALYSQGDLRTAITNLQATANSKTIVNKENVVKVIDVPCPERVQTMLLLCSDRKFYLAVELMLKLLSEGYSVKDILSMAFTVCNHANFKDDIFKLNFLKEIGLTQCKASNGVSSSLQMCGLVARLCFLSPLPPKPQTPKPTTSASASSNVSVSKVDAKDGK